MTDAWNGTERRGPDIRGRRMGEHEINPECIERTTKALAEAHKLAYELELRIQDMRREREQQLGEITTTVKLLAQSVSTLADNQKQATQDHKEELDKAEKAQKLQQEMNVTMKTTLDILMDERSDALKATKESKGSWRSFFMGLLEKAAWVAVGVIGLSLIEFIKSYLSKGG